MVSNENDNQQVPTTNDIIQSGVAEKNLRKAIITLPSGEQCNFFIHKNAKGKILTDLVAESQSLLEKDYFGLKYTDEYGEKSWLYPDKRINKQIKNEWIFAFQVKFYPPEPSVLADDLTRFLLYLQIRDEIYEGKLPVSFPIQVLLAAIVMQAETGDYETTQQSPQEYDNFVKNSRIIPNITDEFLQKVREIHKEQKGLTTQEAHQKYLDTAKKLAKYGFTFFNGKDSKNGLITIGIYAHGICIYKDQVQIHRFLWQGIVKILFRGSRFSIVLKEGELDDKKEVTVHYKMPDYNTSKRVYRTAVEHHTFFRLIKPEDKPKPGLLRRWGSDKFRYQGRTYFQAKMASQMFDSPMATVQRTSSGRPVSRSVDDLVRQKNYPTSPSRYVDETTQQISSPEKSYSLKLSKEEKAKQKAEEKLAKKERKKEEKRRKKEEKELKKKNKKSRDVSSSSSSSSDSHSDAEIEERHVVISQAVSGPGPVERLHKNRELGDISNTIDEDKATNKDMAPQNSYGATHIDPNSSGPYTPAKDNDGRVIREETIEQVYRISGTGIAPKFDPSNTSFKSTVNKYMEETDKAPRIQMVEANISVKENAPLPQTLREGSAPHTTVHTWHETEAGPETVLTEVDKYGNKVTKTIKTQHTKHTVQKQTYQTYALDENQPEQMITKTDETHTPLNNQSVVRSPVVNTHTRTIAYEKGNEPDRGTEPIGELVSTKTITTGNRTVEILTYKTEKDGVIETRVEHRVTIHDGAGIDHDAELAKALLEATQLSPDLIINRVEVQKTTQS